MTMVTFSLFKRRDGIAGQQHNRRFPGMKFLVIYSGESVKVKVTIKGYSHISDVAVSRDLSQAFVAMWFSDEMKEPYEKGIRPAIEQLGYKPLKIDDKPDVDKIDDEIIGEIRRSRFLVADFIHGAQGARGGVYYEAGFAYGLGLPVIRSCRRDIIDHNELHFDVRQPTT